MGRRAQSALLRRQLLVDTLTGTVSELCLFAEQQARL